MTRRLLAFLVLITALGAAGAAFATLIDLGIVTRDTNTNLDWLDVGETPVFWAPLRHGKAAFANTYNFLDHA